MSDLVTLQRDFHLNDRLNDSLNYFLIEISGKIQLTETQKKKAIGHYEAIADVLRNSPENTLLSKLDVKMIPFGGLGTNTATKPFQGDEFDLDLIIRFHTQIHAFGSAEKLYMEVYNTLKANGIYKDNLEKKDRCIRLYYSGDFYLDLMPAVTFFRPDHDSTRLLVPEEQENGIYQLEMVDPIAMMTWFEKQCDLEKTFNSLKALSEHRDFEAMPLTTEDAKKSVLKQAVQLLKRARDVYFTNDPEAKKILKSVVILTVAGELYYGQRDLYALVELILNKLDQLTVDFSNMKLSNPMHGEENFLESLSQNPERYKKLRKFISSSKSTWYELKNPKSIPQQSKLLSDVFGETVTKTVLTEYGTRMDEMYKASTMKMNASGILGTSAAATGLRTVQKHQFFGDK